MRKLIVLLAVSLVMGGTSMADTVFFDDGLAHTFNDDTYQGDTIYLDYTVINDPGTHMDLVAGGTIGGGCAYNNATIIMSDGTVNGHLYGFSSSDVTMSSGTVWGELVAFDESVVTMSGGTVGSHLYALHDSTATMSGGLVSNNLNAQDDSKITMSGGTVGGALYVVTNGIIYLEGSGFEVTAEGVTTSLSYGDKLSDFGTFVSSGQGYYTGTITGNLADSTALSNTFRIYNTGDNAGTGDIIIVPEPATIGLLGLGCVMLRRGKKVVRI